MSPRTGATPGTAAWRRPRPVARTAHSPRWNALATSSATQEGESPPRTRRRERRAGTYFLGRTSSLPRRTPARPMPPWSIAGNESERPLLVGGKSVAGFMPYKDDILVTDVATQGLKGIAFRQLFFDGRRQILARYPNFDPTNPYAGGWAYVDGQPVEMYRDRPEDSKRLLHTRPRMPVRARIRRRARSASSRGTTGGTTSSA